MQQWQRDIQCAPLRQYRSQKALKKRMSICKRLRSYKNTKKTNVTDALIFLLTQQARRAEIAPLIAQPTYAEAGARCGAYPECACAGLWLTP
jgi:hypothetical protein